MPVTLTASLSGVGLAGERLVISGTVYDHSQVLGLLPDGSYHASVRVGRRREWSAGAERGEALELDGMPNGREGPDGNRKGRAPPPKKRTLTGV